MTDTTVLRERHGAVEILTFNRPQKRNALNDRMLAELKAVAADLSPEVRALVVRGAGPGFCSGLDLAEHRDRTPHQVLTTSRRWHAVIEELTLAGRPIVAALHGAVIGGGFEFAAGAHIRIADRSAFFQLPEAQRGVFIGGGGSVSIARVIGVGRMTELMLTGRRLDVDAAERIGLVHQVVEPEALLETALETAQAVARNPPMVNYLIVNALPRIADMSAQDGLFAESLAAAVSQSGDESHDGMQAFLSGRKTKAAE